MPPYLLVVESDPELQHRIGETLREASYEYATETEGAWAKRSVLIRPPDAVIIDTSLADGSGFAVADALRKDPDTEKIPIFFVASRFRGASHRTEARRRYAPAEYFPTPLDVDTLLARVLEAIPPRPATAPSAIPDYPGFRMADSAQRREKREVEAAARGFDGRTAAMRGSLAREPFARLVQRLYTERATGALLLAHEDVKKIVYFRDGYPVSVRSNVLSECLGQILVARRMINEEILDESLRRMRDERRHQGEILVEMGALSPHNLERALHAQMEAKLYDVFEWTAGTFRFADGKPAPDQPVALETSAAAIILEGIRRHYDVQRQEAVLARFEGQYVTPHEDPRQRLQDISTDPAERAFVESLDGTRKLDAVLDSAPISAHEARLLLVAMAEAGIIGPSRTPARRNDEARGGRPAEDDLADTRPPERRAREELVALYQEMLQLNHFEVLGVGEDAGSAEIARAYEARAREFHPDRFRRQPEGMREVAMQIFQRLGEASEALSDPGRRRRYVARLERERPAAVAAASHSPPVAAEQVYYAGVEHLRQRRYEDAAQAFRHAIALAPLQPSYHGALGWSLYRTAPNAPQAVEAALEELRRAVDLGDGDPWVHVSLARFYVETGAPDQAVAEFEAALRINGGLTDVQDEIRRLRGEA